MILNYVFPVICNSFRREARYYKRALLNFLGLVNTENLSVWVAFTHLREYLHGCAWNMIYVFVRRLFAHEYILIIMLNAFVVLDYVFGLKRKSSLVLLGTAIVLVVYR